MKISIVEFIFLIQKQISQKYFEIFCRFMNTFLQIRAVCTDKCISEIPRIPKMYFTRTDNPEW